MNFQTPSTISLPGSTSSTSNSPAPFIMSPGSQTTSTTGPNPTTPPLAASDANGTGPEARNDNVTTTMNPPPPDVDPQIIEALKSKDRIYVLKLGELMEGLIKERRQRVDLTPATSYQRLLVHRCSAYYRLVPENDPITKGISVHPTPDSRIPERRICELVPPESTSQPAFKIMRRSPSDRRPKPQSRAGSVAGEDADLSDVEPSEAGSLGGRSNATGGSTKKHMTIQEREAAYNEARSRIFMDFEEKEKAKEKDMSASSSSLSLNSASASTSANGDASSLGDADNSLGSPTTESEWSGPSGPITRERKDNRRGGSGNASASSSSRSLRSGGSLHGNGSNPGSRNSRASSPSFTYASLYEPAPTQQLYDPSQPSSQMNPPYHGTQYYLPFPPHTQASNQPYMPPYQYYPPYGPYPPVPAEPHHHNSSDPALPRNMEPYPAPQPMNYGMPYMWQPNQNVPLQSPPVMQPMPPPQQQHQPPGHPMTSPPPHSPPYPYMHPPGYAYPVPAYYPHPPPPGQPMHPPPPQIGPQNQLYDPRSANNHVVSPGGHNVNGPSQTNNGSPSHNGGRGPSVQHTNGRNSRNTSTNGINNSNKRNPPSANRSPWSYGPGVGSGGFNPSAMPGGGEVVGPRLNSSRRQSNNTSTSSNTSRASASSVNDEVSSVASSSTSSSSRRTYTSTASSQHPLPPRPDWAVGLKPPLGPNRHHESRHNMQSSRNMNGNNSNQSSTGPTPPISLQGTDFPPLTPLAPAPEKRNPIPNGAWGNATNRSILSPVSGGSAAGNHSPNARNEDGEGSSKNGDLYNPKLVRRPTVNVPSPGKDKEKDASGKSGEGLTTSASSPAVLDTQFKSLSIDERIASVENPLLVDGSLAVQAASTKAAV